MTEVKSWNNKYLNDSRSTDELIAFLLEKDMDAEGEAYWHALWALQFRLSSIFDQIDRLLASENPKTREFAALVLGQNSVNEQWNAPECAGRLLPVVDKEEDLRALSSMIHAVGSLHHRQSIGVVAKFEHHPVPDVRNAVVFCLSGYEDDQAVAALIRLSGDTDNEVRNWATFGLGSQTDVNSAPMRDALFARTDDSEAEIRGEAIVGLARRGDARVIQIILRELSLPMNDVSEYCSSLMDDTADAAAKSSVASRNPAWLPVLTRFLELNFGDTCKIKAAIQQLSTPNE